MHTQNENLCAQKYFSTTTSSLSQIVFSSEAKLKSSLTLFDFLCSHLPTNAAVPKSTISVSLLLPKLKGHLGGPLYIQFWAILSKETSLEFNETEIFIVHFVLLQVS